MKCFLISALTLITLTTSLAQVSEDFEDETLGNSPDLFSPLWGGDVDQFILVDESGNQQLRSNAGDLASSLEYAISTPSTAIHEASWEFFINLKFSTSGSNYVDVFLVSDNADLSSTQNGYFVRIGDTEDFIALHKIDDGSSTENSTPLISTSEGLVNGSSSNPFRIRVTRDASGLWELLVDEDDTGVFVSIESVTDVAVESSSHFGIFVLQSGATSPADNHFFDDFIVTGSTTPDTTSPTIQSTTAVSATEVDILFSEIVDQTTSETPANYSLDGGATVSNAIRDGSNSALVHLTTSALTNGDIYSVTINNVEDESSNAITVDSQDSFEYLVIEEAEARDIVVNEFYAAPNSDGSIPNEEYIELYNSSEKFIQLENWTFSDATGTSSTFSPFRLDPNQYVILTNTGNGTAFNSYGDVLEVASFRALNNGGDDIILTNSLATEIYSITYTSSTSGISTEMINPNGPDYSINNYGLSTDPDGGTPGTINSIFDDTPDTTPPNIESIEVLSSTELDITFSESLQESTANVSGNYSIDGGITVSNSERDNNNNLLVHLTVSELVSGDTRTLTITNVTDLSGNSIDANSTIDFEYLLTEEAIAGDIVISEFYASPNSESTIPNVEFLEIYNRSEKFIDLENWIFSDQSSSSSSFGSFIIRPDSFVILVETDNGELFDSYGDWIEVGNFPSLNNGGDSIIVSNSASVIIHEIKYSSSTSGKSTEIINPNGPDYSYRNFDLSINPDGGTPGSINSIFDDTPDTMAPILDSISVVSKTQLEVYFNEPLTETSVENLANYTVDGGITISSAQRDNSDIAKVHLIVADLVSGNFRTLTVSGVADFSGNAIASGEIAFRYIEIEAAAEGDVVINEFYANPNEESTIPDREFIELFNLSNKFIDVENWTYSDLTGTSSTFPSFVLEPDSFLILTTNSGVSSFESYGDVIGVGSFRSLSASDQITITNANAILIHQISYTEAASGITTELINPNGPDYSYRNYGLSTNTFGGTPGSINSIFNDTPDTIAPILDSISVVSKTQLEVYFNEPLTEISVGNLANYAIDGGITISSAERDDSDIAKIHLVVSDLVSGDFRTLNVSGVADLSGNAIASGEIAFRYIQIEEAAEGDVVINEFYANTDSESTIPDREFIELFNRSAKYINVENWIYSDLTDTTSVFPSFILEPDSFLMLTANSAVSSFESYGNVIGVGSFRSLANSDQITITNANAILIHQISYTDATSGITTELINPNGPDYSYRNYGLSTNTDGGTPGSINSIFDDTPDAMAPILDSISVVSQTQLDIYFNEPLNEISSETISNFTIDGGIAIIGAERDELDNAKIQLIVSELVSGDVRTLTVNDVADLSGNPSISEEIQFRYIEIEEAEQGDVVINEFYASPNAGSSLPNKEFVELFNLSNKYIDVEGWIYSDLSDTSSTFQSYVLEPDSFLILTTNSAVSSYERYGDVIGVGSFRSLGSSDQITIINANGVLVHQISYTEVASAITTELINPNGPDYSYRNYGFSINAEGGTPGSVNSIFDDTPDTISPILESINVISSTELSLILNEPLGKLSAENSNNYAIDGMVSILSVHLYDTANHTIQLIVSDLPSAEIRTLTINNVADLSDNEIAGNSTIEFEYIETELAAAGDIVINEFYATPSSESTIPSVEFVELFNRSNKFIELKGWTFSDNSDTSNPFDSFIIRPGNFLVLTEINNGILFDAYGDWLEIKGFPNLNNGGDSIIIKDEFAGVIHEITFADSGSGITTELINPNGPDYSSRNYNRSTDPAGGTPSRVNSIFDDTPDTTAPSAESINVVSSTELELVFDEPLKKIPAETIANYSIDGGITISSAVRYDTASNVVQLTVSALPSAQVRTVTINNVVDLSGNEISINSSIEFEYLETEKAIAGDILINEFLADPVDNNDDFVELWNVSEKYIDLTGWKIRDIAATSTGFSPFVIRPNEYVIIYDKDATIDYPSFGNAISIPSLTLNNDEDQIELLTSDSTFIAFISYFDQPEEAVSSELINPNDPCINELSYGASIATFGSTPGTQNSIFDDSPDTTAPMITSYSFDEELSIKFSETMDANSLQNGTYEIDGLTINGISANAQSSLSVEISFIESLELGTLYEMSVSNVSDCWGNVIQPAILSFGIGRSPVFNEILITEIMSDPDPTVSLPDQEFIEIYNSSTDIIRLDGITFSDASSSTVLPTITINPAVHLVLTSNSGVAKFSDGAIGVTGFPSLSNSGEQLILSTNESLLFSVTYDKSWHSTVENEAGGVSLEMIDISNPCAEANNWTSSNDSRGGTPGNLNSVSGNVPDNFPPEIVKVTAISADSIKVDFNEKIDPTLVNLVIETIEPEVSIQSKNADYLSPKSLFLVLDESLKESTLYNLTFSNVLDCSGNASAEQQVDFALPSAPGNNQILLSEVLFNPYTNGVDFVELYNNSDNYLNLKNWQLANLTDDEVDNQKEISNEQLVFEPRSFMALSINSNVLFTNYPKGNRENFFQMESLPTYANNEGTVVLLNQDSLEIERFTYSDDFHYGLLNSLDGVSLERISYSAVNDGNNWRSASSTIGFATPGYQNSQSFEAQVPKGTIQVEPKVFIPGDSGSGRDFTLISYQLETAGQFANITVYDQSGRLVRTLAEGILLANSGFIRWDGTTDNGALARLGYHVVLFEIYDSNGTSQTIKETVVVGRDF